MDERMKQWIFDRVIWMVGLVIAVFLAAPSFAGERERVVATSDTWRGECGSFHRGAVEGDLSERIVDISGKGPNDGKD